MPTQGIELKEHFKKAHSRSKWASSRFALPIFLLIGLGVNLCIFLVLQSFIQSLAKDERVRMSQDFVEGMVEQVHSLEDPLAILANLITFTGDNSPKAMAQTLQDAGQALDKFQEVLWFYKDGGGKWTYRSVISRGTADGSDGATILKPNAAMLKVLLEKGADQATAPHIITNLEGLELVEERQSPRIMTGPFAIVKATGSGLESTGFILGVINPASLFDDKWINEHRQLSFVRLREISENRMLFLFERDAKQSDDISAARQIYEFPFADQKWEISSVLTQDQRSQFLSMFPFVIVAFGFILVAAGALYLRSNFKQAQAVSRMNEILEQKNYELKSEVSERERLNQALRDAEAENRAVIDSVGDIIFETDKEGRLKFLNKAWVKTTGFEIEQSIGQDIFNMIYPLDQQPQRAEFKNLLKGNKREMRTYTQLRTSDGTFLAIEMALVAIQQDERKGMRLIGTLTNIEERRRAERALSEAEKKYRNIVENAAGGIYQLTPEGLFLSANPALARILGYDTPEQLLREIKNANEATFVDGQARASLYRELNNKETVRNFETRMRKRNGDIIWVNENARVVKDENGQVLFIEGSIEDITQRKQSDSAIREAKRNSDMANRAKSEFLSNMSHELRTPLNAIIGFSDMIKNEVLGQIDQPAYKEYATDINQSGQKLLRVINEILDISKIEAGERQLNEAVVHINELVDSSLYMLDEKIRASRMIITRSLDDVPEIVGEELALKQVILNLLSNAVKFTPDGGRITISGHVSSQGNFHFSVTDTGVGLDEMEIKKALSPFGQLNNELSRSGSGTGLGLTLVDALIKLHGGEFELFSQKGIGTTATMILPSDRIMKKKEKAPPPVPKIFT
jgi:PAS domain S-box-containing protein